MKVAFQAINVAYYQELMRGMRAAIESGRFEAFRAKTKEGWERGKEAS